MQKGKTFQSSHAVLPHLPSLQLGSSMSAQVTHERSGRLIEQASSMSLADKNRIAKALAASNVDLSKAQDTGHAHSLAANLAESVVHHILFAKSQVSEPVSVSRRRRQLEVAEAQLSSKRRKTSTRSRKEDRMLKKLDTMCKLLKDAFDSLTALDGIPGSSTSSAQLTNHDSRLVLILGSSASMPREVFVVDLIDVVQRPTDVCLDIDTLLRSATLDTEHLVSESHTLPETSLRQQQKAREKTSSQWERKLVRMMVSEEELEPFFSSPSAPTRLHVFLSASPRFRCPGWSARRHLNFDLSALFANDTDACSSADVTMSSDADVLRGEPMCSSPQMPQAFSHTQDGAESVSSLTSSWFDSASDSVFETSNSSFSDTGTQPQQSASREQGLDAEKGALMLEGVDTDDAENLASSSGSATLRNDAEPASTDSSDLHSKRSLADSQSSPNNKRMRESTMAPILARRAKAPAANSLLSRNLLRPKDGSDSGSTRSSRKRLPRCAGIRIDFSDPDSPRQQDDMPAPPEERCWFQCDSVLEGYR